MPDTFEEAANRPEISVAPADRTKRRGRTLILAACLMATFVTATESTIVATAMPTIVGDLGGFELFSWVFTIFLLAQAVSIPIYGRLADMFGRKKVFFIGISLFLTGSILCGFAWAMVPLICFRALQGLGAGAIQPITATILGDIYTPAERAQVQGLVSSVFGVSAVAGPSLGAFLIAQVSWSSVFWVSVPIAAVSVIMIALFLHETGEPRQRSIDWPGALLMWLTVGSLTLALVQGGRLTPLMFNSVLIAGVVSAVLLVLHERSTREPMLPLELWRKSRVVVVSSLGSFAAAAMMSGIASFLPAYVQAGMGLSPMIGGIVLGAMSVSWSFASVVGGRIMVRTSYRLVAILGSISLITGSGLLIAVPASAGPAFTIAASLIVGIGLGFCMSVFIVSIQAAVPWHQRGAATSSNMFMRFMGQVLGVSGCGAVLNATILRLDPGAAQAMDQMLNPLSRAALPPAEVAHLTEVVTRGLHNAWLLAGLFAVMALVVSCLMPARLSPRSPAAAN